MFLLGVVVDGVVFLVVESQSGRMGADPFVLHGFDEVLALIDNNFVGLGGIVFIFQLKFVAGEGLDWQVGGQNGTVFSHNVGGLCDVARGDVVEVRFVCFGHG